jgi:hypothetical protein
MFTVPAARVFTASHLIFFRIGGSQSGVNDATPISDWLVAVNPALGKYAEAFEEYGYGNAGMLLAAEAADLTEAFAEVNVKKPHQKLLLKHLASGGGAAVGGGGGGGQHRQQHSPAPTPPATPTPTPKSTQQAAKEPPETVARATADESNGSGGVGGECEEGKEGKEGKEGEEGGGVLPRIGDEQVHQASVDLESKYATPGTREKGEVERWFKNYDESSGEGSPAVKKMHGLVKRVNLKGLLKMCRNGKIAADARVYTVPLMNWLGQYQNHGVEQGQQGGVHPIVPLVECLMTEVQVN